MEVVIIGAGSIGLLFGSFLAESKQNITMFVRNEAQSRLLKEKGISRINEDGSESIAAVNATTDYDQLSTAQLIIIAVKYVDLKDVLNELRMRKIKTPLLFIQNGIGHLTAVEAKDFPHVSFATVEHGALKTNPYTVKHNGVGNVTIGEWFGERRKFDRMASAHQESFPVIRHENAEFILLRKALINCLINPLTTILGVANGELLTNSYGNQLMRELYDELIKAFPEMKDELPFAKVESVCRQTAKNHSSMLTDCLARRPMEIETIVSAIIQKAQLKQRPLPLLKTYEKILYVLDAKEER